MLFDDTILIQLWQYVWYYSDIIIGKNMNKLIGVVYQKIQIFDYHWKKI